MNAQQRIERQLEEVLKLPGNDKCADCRASAPRWASVNIGIFLCVTCASIHRKMGTHRSRVKSVTLDEWTREQVSHMREVGNTRSNEIYNPDEGRHPPPAATGIDERDSELSKYIRRKYELGAFKRAASKDLASSNAITSRALARDARSGHSKDEILPPLRAEDLPRRGERDLPALPPTSGRRPARGLSNQPLWSGLSSQNTGTSSTSQNSAGSAPSIPVLPTRSSSASSASPMFNANGAGPSTAAALLRQPPKQAPAANLLVDVAGSSSSTRPLQLNGFPTVPAVPAWQNAAQQQQQQQAALSPFALGQQAFLSPNSTNPFGMQQQQVSSPQSMQASSYFQAMQPTGASPSGSMLSPGMTGMGSSMNGGMMMGHSPMNGGMLGHSPMNGMGMGSMGMSSSPMNGMGGMGGMNGMGGMGVSPNMHMGMNMNGMGMNGMGAMGVPVQQPNPWAAYGA